MFKSFVLFGCMKNYTICIWLVYYDALNLCYRIVQLSFGEWKRLKQITF